MMVKCKGTGLRVYSSCYSFRCQALISRWCQCVAGTLAISAPDEEPMLMLMFLFLIF